MSAIDSSVTVNYVRGAVIETWRLTQGQAVQLGTWLDENMGPADVYVEGEEDGPRGRILETALEKLEDLAREDESDG